MYFRNSELIERGRTQSDDILTEMIQIEIILIIPKGIFDLFTGDYESEEDETSDHGSWDSDPSERLDDLERKCTDVEECCDPEMCGV